MSDVKDGGPAFPRTIQRWNDSLEQRDGMTLRDYFAAHAPEAPEWFSFEPKPEAPTYPLGYFSKNPHLRKAVSDAYEEEKQAFPARLAKWRMERIAAWRFAYADAMLAAREADQ